MSLTMESIIVASRDQVASRVAGETVILSLSKERYFGVNGVGSSIWDMIQSPVRLAEVKEMLLRRYAVADAECEADLLRWIEHLSSQGLVEVNPAPSR